MIGCSRSRTSSAWFGWCWFRCSSTCCWHTAYGWTVAILMFSGFSDWADGKIARLVPNQSSGWRAARPAGRPGLLLAVPVGLGLAGIVPWWVVGVLVGRDAVLAATLPVLRSAASPRCR